MYLGVAKKSEALSYRHNCNLILREGRRAWQSVNEGRRRRQKRVNDMAPRTLCCLQLAHFLHLPSCYFQTSTLQFRFHYRDFTNHLFLVLFVDKFGGLLITVWAKSLLTKSRISGNDTFESEKRKPKVKGWGLGVSIFCPPSPLTCNSAPLLLSQTPLKTCLSLHCFVWKTSSLSSSFYLRRSQQV